MRTLIENGFIIDGTGKKGFVGGVVVGGLFRRGIVNSREGNLHHLGQPFGSGAAHQHQQGQKKRNKLFHGKHNITAVGVSQGGNAFCYYL